MRTHDAQNTLIKAALAAQSRASAIIISIIIPA